MKCDDELGMGRTLSTYLNLRIKPLSLILCAVSYHADHGFV
uniref:Uncharacterized protein n=1 Tax=Setaria italica TaxID=4555 RepID=K3Z1M6_SETIT